MEAALLAVVEGGDALRDHEGLPVTVYQSFPQQAGEVQGAAQAASPAGGGAEAEQVGDRPGAEEGRPVAAYGRVVGVVAAVPVAFGQAGGDPGGGDGGAAQAGDLRRQPGLARLPRRWEDGTDCASP